MPQVSGAFEPTSNKTRRSGLKRALTAISNIYGNPAWFPDESADGRDVLSALILTILSQATTDGNRDVAYARFRRRFPTWEKVLEADVNKVEEAIRPGGLSRQRSARIQALLAWLKKTRNELSAEFLRDLVKAGRSSEYESEIRHWIEEVETEFVFSSDPTDEPTRDFVPSTQFLKKRDLPE